MLVKNYNHGCRGEPFCLVQSSLLLSRISAILFQPSKVSSNIFISHFILFCHPLHFCPDFYFKCYNLSERVQNSYFRSFGKGDLLLKKVLNSFLVFRIRIFDISIDVSLFFYPPVILYDLQVKIN